MMMQKTDHNSIWKVLKRYYKSIRVTFGCQRTGVEKLETCIGITLEANALETALKDNKIKSMHVYEARKKRIRKDYAQAKEFAQKPSFLAETIRFLLNIVLTIIYEFAMILQKVVFNYFGGYLVIGFVMIGEYRTYIRPSEPEP